MKYQLMLKVLFRRLLCLSVRFNGHFPGGSGLAADIRMSPFWILFELRMTDIYYSQTITVMILTIVITTRVTGVGGLTKGFATLPQGASRSL